MLCSLFFKITSWCIYIYTFRMFIFEFDHRKWSELHQGWLYYMSSIFSECFFFHLIQICKNLQRSLFVKRSMWLFVDTGISEDWFLMSHITSNGKLWQSHEGAKLMLSLLNGSETWRETWRKVGHQICCVRDLAKICHGASYPIIWHQYCGIA